MDIRGTSDPNIYRFSPREGIFAGRDFYLAQEVNEFLPVKRVMTEGSMERALIRFVPGLKTESFVRSAINPYLNPPEVEPIAVGNNHDAEILTYEERRSLVCKVMGFSAMNIAFNELSVQMNIARILREARLVTPSGISISAPRAYLAWSGKPGSGFIHMPVGVVMDRIRNLGRVGEFLKSRKGEEETLKREVWETITRGLPSEDVATYFRDQLPRNIMFSRRRFGLGIIANVYDQHTDEVHRYDDTVSYAD